jgi:hypothetical protein
VLTVDGELPWRTVPLHLWFAFYSHYEGNRQELSLDDFDMKIRLESIKFVNVYDHPPECQNRS